MFIVIFILQLIKSFLFTILKGEPTAYRHTYVTQGRVMEKLVRLPTLARVGIVYQDSVANVLQQEARPAVQVAKCASK
jgi:hypothetical protein